MKRGKILATGGACASVALLTLGLCACAPHVASDQVNNEAEPAIESSNPMAEAYPLQYGSYYQPDFNRSHSNMAADLDTGSEVKFQTFCVACKSGDFNAIYDRYGSEVFDPEAQPYTVDGIDEDLQEMLGEMWDCASTCHDGDPGSEVAPQVVFFEKLGGQLGEALTPKEAVCGQCHNALASWCEVEDFDVETADPYRYGYDADAVLKAAKEDGARSWVDEATGIVTYKGNHAIAEMYQGSTHQAMGLACTDCHMQVTTDENGETYTDHNASGQIAFSNEKLEKCLECHTEQSGVNTPTDMFYFLRLKQTEITNAQGAAQTKLNDLYDLILDAVENPGSVDEETLNRVKDLYSTSDFYLEWASQTYISRNNQTADSRGGNAAHNYDGAMNYYARAEAVADEAIAF